MKAKSPIIYRCLNWIVPILLFGFFFLLLRHGAGNYWDWSLPYFKDQLGNYLTNNLHAWSDFNLGEPITYATGYLYYGIYYLASLVSLQPEIAQAIIIAGLLSVVFISGRSLFNFYLKNPIIANLLALGLVFNPAIFYKFIAGHQLFFLSYAIITILINFLLTRFKPKFIHAIIIGLLIALSAPQIQYLPICYLILIIFYLTHRQLFRLRDLITILFLTLTINLPWLMNYLVGANSIASSSTKAASAVFNDLIYASPIRIAALIFSKATLLHYYYPRWTLYVFIATSILTVCAVIVFFIRKSHRNNPDFKFGLTSLIVLALLSTGFYHQISLPILDLITPMFREVAHFAPMVVFFGFLVVVIMLRNNRRVIIFTGVITGIFVIINGYVFATRMTTIDFSLIRQYLSPVKSALEEDDTTYRVLTYPFFNQYSFNFIDNQFSQGRLINNSGWDSFIMFSGKEYISNSIDGSDFTNSIQYDLLTSQNIEALKELNVKYLVDLSGIYTSNYELYHNSADYQNNLSLIKNQSDFFNQLMAANPGEITQINSYLYRINNSLPRIDGQLLDYIKVNPSEYVVKINNLDASRTIQLLSSYHSEWKIDILPFSKYQELFTNNNCETVSTPSSINECSSLNTHINDGITIKADHRLTDNNLNQWIIEPNITQTLSGDYYSDSENGPDVIIRIYFEPEKWYLIGWIISTIVIAVTVGLMFILPKYSKAKHATT